MLSGNGGQKVYLVPSLDLIVVFTGGAFNVESPVNDDDGAGPAPGADGYGSSPSGPTERPSIDTGLLVRPVIGRSRHVARRDLVCAHEFNIRPGAAVIRSSCAQRELSLHSATVPHIQLPDGLPGITSGFAFRPGTANRCGELAETLLRGPNSLTGGEREMIAAFVSSLTDCYFCQASHQRRGGAPSRWQLPRLWTPRSVTIERALCRRN